MLDINTISSTFILQSVNEYKDRIKKEYQFIKRLMRFVSVVVRVVPRIIFNRPLPLLSGAVTRLQDLTFAVKLLQGDL